MVTLVDMYEEAQQRVLAKLAAPPENAQHEEHVQAVRHLFDKVVREATISEAGCQVPRLHCEPAAALNMFDIWYADVSPALPPEWRYSLERFRFHMGKLPKNEVRNLSVDDLCHHVLGDLKLYEFLFVGNRRSDSHYSVQPQQTARISCSLNGSQVSEYRYVQFGDGSSVSSSITEGKSVEVKLAYSARLRDNNKGKPDEKHKLEELAIACVVARTSRFTGQVSVEVDEKTADARIGPWLAQITRLPFNVLYGGANSKGHGSHTMTSETVQTALDQSINKKLTKPYPEPHRQLLIIDLSYIGLDYEQVQGFGLAFPQSPLFAHALLVARHWTDVIELW